MTNIADHLPNGELDQLEVEVAGKGAGKCCAALGSVDIANATTRKNG